ncbi:MAG TPA: TolC family protein [Leeuwenhoekiella sp.]|nr:TolC family protein [Leeuwenhoekiella sp.]
MIKKRKYKIVLVLVFCLYAGFAEAQQLQSYIQEAESNNPDIQAYELRYNIAEEKVNEVNSLPNTEFGAGYFVSEPETRTGAQRARFSVKQMLPWFGTITARENYASSMADAEYVEIAIAKRKLALSVSQSYYQLYAITAKQEVLEENIQLLKTYERLALTSVEVGKASAVDVLRLQIRQNELEKQKEVLGEDYLAEKVQFNNLLNKEENKKITVMDTLIIPFENMPFSKDGLAMHPELLKYDKLYESITQSESLNQKESLPNIGFGLDYIPVAERPEMNFSDNGKDILMPMVSVSIPIFNSKYNSRTKQNELRQQEITAQKNERLNTLKTLFAQAKQNRNSARIAFSTQVKNLKQAKDAENILIRNYETGTIDFNDVLDIQELQLKFQMNQIESVKMYYVQSAIINYLTN